jgi:chorismate mutase
MKLEDCRKQIDIVDREIMALLNRRAEIVREIGEMKARAGLPIVDWNREMEILHWVAQENEGVMDDEAAARIFRRILQESRQIQVEIAKDLNLADGVCG